MDVYFDFSKPKLYVSLSSTGEVDKEKTIKIYITPEMKKQFNYDEPILSHHNRRIWDDNYRKYWDYFDMLKSLEEEKEKKQKIKKLQLPRSEPNNNLKKIKKLNCI